MSIDNQIFEEYRRQEKQAFRDRIEFHEPGNDSKHEIWIDWKTMKKYKVAVEIVRDFDNMEEIGNTKV